MIGEIINDNADDVSQDEDSVGVSVENALKASQEDQLGADATLEIIDGKDSYTTSDSITVKMGSYSMASDSSDVAVYLNNVQVATTTYGVIHSSSGYTLSLADAIENSENTIYCSGSSIFGSYTSDTVAFTVNSDSGSGESGSGDNESEITLKIIDVYDKYDGQSSNSHFPYTDDFAFIATSSSNSRYNIVVSFRIEGASSSAKIKYGTTEETISGDTASLEFNTNNVGENTVYVIDGNKRSNEVTVKVVSGANKIASVSLNPEWGVEGQTINLSATAMSSGSSSADGYTQRPISGYLTFYSSNSFTDANKIATISTDGGSFTVPLVDIDAECDYITLYYTFAGEYNNKGFIKSSSYNVYFLVLDSNPITLTGNGQTGNIELSSDKKLMLHINPTYYMNDGQNSFIDVYVGTTKVGSFAASSTTSVSDFELDLTGYDAGDYDVYVNYTGYNFEDTNGDVYYHAGNESNHLNVHIEEESSEKILKIEINQIEYPNNVTAIVTASQIGTYTITINGKTFPIEIVEADNGVKEVTLDKFAAHEDYEAIITSNDDVSLTNNTYFNVTKGTATLNVAVTGNESVVNIGEKTITVTVDSYNATGKVQFYEEGTQIGEDKNLGEALDISSLNAGTHSITVKYIDDDNYDADDEVIQFVIIKDVLTITLTRTDDDDVVVPGSTVSFTITYSVSVSDNLELWINDYKLNDEDGGDSTSITFDESDIGANDVFIKFLGNDYYEACVSNNVTIEVINPIATTVSIQLNPNEVLSGQNITIIPTVLDENGMELTTGVVKIYESSYYYNYDPLTVINAGENGTYVDTTHYAGQTTYLYAVYFPSEKLYKQSSVSSGVTYTLLNSNTLDLTVNGAKEITVEEGVEFNVLATLTGGDGVISLYDNGEFYAEITKNSQVTMTLPIGNHTLYAKYAKGSDTYVSCQSEEVIIHVVEKAIQNEITVSVEDIVLPNQAEIKVTALIDGEYTVDVNGTEVKVNVLGGSGTNYISLTTPGSYYANVTGQNDAIITNAVFTVSPEPIVGELIIRDATYPENATIEISGEGNVTIYIEYYLIKPVLNPTTETLSFDIGGVIKTVENPVNGTYTGAFRFTINETADFNVKASYKSWEFMGSEYFFESNLISYSVNITDPTIYLDVTVDDEKDENDYYEDEWGYIFDIVTTASKDIEGTIIYKEGDKELGRSNIGETFELNASSLGLGEHEITAILEGSEDTNYTFTVNINKKTIWYQLTIDDVTYPNHPIAKLYGEDVDGEYTITINGVDYDVVFEWYDEEAPVSFDIDQLPVGTYTVSAIKYEDMEHYVFGVSEIEGQNTLPTFEVKTGEIALDDTVLKSTNGTDPTFSIDLANATGNLTVTVNGRNYTSELKDGKATVTINDLPAGNYSATVTYSGDKNYKSTSTEAKFTVDLKTVDANSTLDVNIPEGSTNPVFSINLPNATGNLTVIVDGKNYTKALVNGSATITIEDLTPGNHNVTVIYTGDEKFAPISKNTTITIPTPKLSNIKNIKAIYSATATYKVLVTAKGIAVVGENVSIKFNGKTYNVKTDAKGYATLKLNTKIKVKTYIITCEFKGVKATSKVTIKHLIKAKNLKAKKSKKFLKIKVSTKKVNGKFFKGKKLTLKFKGKKYKAKINKKGVATFKVKKNVLKKLKVGKKYSYKVSYGKDSVSKKIKIKR